MADESLTFNHTEMARIVLHEEDVKKGLLELFKKHKGTEKMFYSIMSNDACGSRHLIIEPSILKKKLPLDNGKDIGSPKPNTIRSLGVLEILPNETLNEIMENLDLESLTKFREVSQTARYTVDNLYKYKGIMYHAPQILRATFALGLAHRVTLEQIDAALASKVCKDCGEFGAYLHVPTTERVCYKCFTTNEIRQPLLYNHVRVKFQIRRKELLEVPDNEPHDDKWLRIIPGRYKVKGQRNRDRKRWLMDYEEAVKLKMSLTGLSRDEVIRYSSIAH